MEKNQKGFYYTSPRTGIGKISYTISLVIIGGIMLGACSRYIPNITLPEAVKAGQEKAVKAHIKNGMLVNQKDEDGIPVLVLAVQKGNINIIKQLLKAGANAEIKGSNGITPLCMASLTGNTKVISLLLKAGANIDEACTSPRGLLTPNMEEKKKAALMKIAEKMYRYNPEKLRNSLQDIEKNNKRISEKKTTKTPLEIAIINEQLKAMKLLLKKGALVSNDMLADASYMGNILAVKALLKAGLINVNASDDEGTSVLMFASEGGNVDIVNILIDHGADINAKSKDGNTALRNACITGQLEIVKKLIKAGADVNAADENNQTILMEAAGAGQLEVVKILIASGADVNASSFIGWINKPLNGWTALMMASQFGNIDIVKELLAAGADVNEEDVDGVTALMLASENGYAETVKILLDAGAGIVAGKQDRRGWSAANYAWNSGHANILGLFPGSSVSCVKGAERCTYTLPNMTNFRDGRTWTSISIDSGKVHELGYQHLEEDSYSLVWKNDSVIGEKKEELAQQRDEEIMKGAMENGWVY